MSLWRLVPKSISWFCAIYVILHCYQNSVQLCLLLGKMNGWIDHKNSFDSLCMNPHEHVWSYHEKMLITLQRCQISNKFVLFSPLQPWVTLWHEVSLRNLRAWTFLVLSNHLTSTNWSSRKCDQFHQCNIWSRGTDD